MSLAWISWSAAILYLSREHLLICTSQKRPALRESLQALNSACNSQQNGCYTYLSFFCSSDRHKTGQARIVILTPSSWAEVKISWAERICLASSEEDHRRKSQDGVDTASNALFSPFAERPCSSPRIEKQLGPDGRCYSLRDEFTSWRGIKFTRLRQSFDPIFHAFTVWNLF